MARAGDAMQITAVDDENNLFWVRDIMPADLVDQILCTPWMSLAWTRQSGQESWRRRKINSAVIPWMAYWNQCCQQLWPSIAESIGMTLHNHFGTDSSTAWWLDEPGFTCGLHTDGEMPGAMQLNWIGAVPTLGTAFYNYKDPDSLRHQFLMQANSGYVMINQPNSQEFRRLQWHGMLTPVPANTFRLTSYTWITPK
jgi:hypothetical protein